MKSFHPKESGWFARNTIPVNDEMTVSMYFFANDL